MFYWVDFRYVLGIMFVSASSLTGAINLFSLHHLLSQVQRIDALIRNDLLMTILQLLLSPKMQAKAQILQPLFSAVWYNNISKVSEPIVCLGKMILGYFLIPKRKK